MKSCGENVNVPTLSEVVFMNFSNYISPELVILSHFSA
jgi:hypothetical protein